MKFDWAAKAECAFEANAPKPNGMECTLVRISKATQRRKVLLGKVLAVMAEVKTMIFDADRCLRCSSVVRVLKQFRQDVSGTLNLLKELMPGARQFRVAL
jgi:hypothetical protein